MRTTGETQSSSTRADRFDFVAKLGFFPDKVRAVRAADPRRALSVVYLDVNTNVCNHSCTFCDGFYRPLTTKSIPTNRLMRLADEMAEAGVLAVVIAGERGEPTLHPGLPRLLHRLAAHGIEVGMYTNGSIITEPLMTALAQLSWLRISADAATAQTHRVMHVYAASRDDFASMLRNLGQMSGRVPDIGMSFILDTANVGEIEAAADLYLEAGAQFIEYKPKYLPDYTLDEKWLISNRDVIRASIADAQRRWGDRVVLNNQVVDLLATGAQPTLERAPRHCLTSLLRMVISSHGCYSCTPYRGEQVRRFGDILTQSLDDILRSAARARLLDLPCARICAYDRQNDHLLGVRRGELAVAVAEGGPGRQDHFI